MAVSARAADEIGSLQSTDTCQLRCARSNSAFLERDVEVEEHKQPARSQDSAPPSYGANPARPRLRGDGQRYAAASSSTGYGFRSSATAACPSEHHVGVGDHQGNTSSTT